MKYIIIFALVGLGMAQFQARPDPRQPEAFRQPTRHSEEPIAILRFDNVNNGDGSYKFAYETANGIAAQEEGVLKTRQGEEPIQAVQGFFQYPAPEGEKIRVDYTADERGFIAQGDHLPKPPPIPEAIQKALAIIYANAENQKRNEPSRGRFQ